MQQRIIEKTVISPTVSVITMDRAAEHELVGLHATLKTFVSGVDGIDPETPYVSYGTEMAARLGHEQVVAEIRRMLLKREAVQERGIPAATVDGWL